MRTWKLGEICEHGKLGRQCLVCESQDECAELRADLAVERERATGMQAERDAANKRASEMHRRTQAAEALVAQAKEERDAAVRFTESVADIGVRMGMAVAGRTEGGGATPYGIVRELEMELTAERERAGKLREPLAKLREAYGDLVKDYDLYNGGDARVPFATFRASLDSFLAEADFALALLDAAGGGKADGE